jgi:glycosyltransferase involved in cell wall biosynthesis
MFLIPHLSGGGAERILSELTASLDVEELVLVVFEPRASYPFRGKLISLDLPINRQSVSGRIWGFIRRIARFRQILRRERPDTVVSFMGEANFINALLSPFPILTVHNHPSTVSKSRGSLEALAFEMLLRVLHRRCAIVAVSDSVKRDLVENFRLQPDRIVVIPNAVNAVEIRKLAAEKAICPWKQGLPVVLTAGRLHPQKGQWHLLRAFREVHKNIPCQLAILGTGDLEQYLRELAAELGIQESVYFLGWQKNPFQFMARADLFVLPSVSEGFGLALLEAMACGLPVVASDCPGAVKEIIAPKESEEYGVLVPALDGRMHGASEPCTPAEAELAERIIGLLRDGDMRKRYVDAGLKRIRDFDHASFVQNYRSLIGS